MNNVKRFEIDVESKFDGAEYDELFPLRIEDLGIEYADAMQGANICEIEIIGDGGEVKFLLDLKQIEALFDVLTHIKAKVLATKKPDSENL